MTTGETGIFIWFDHDRHDHDHNDSGCDICGVFYNKVTSNRYGY